MALKKEVETPYGIKAYYWRLDQFQYFKHSQTMIANVGLYVDEESAKLASDPILTNSCSFPVDDMSQDLRKLCYEKIKELILTDAEDV